jgi:nitroreductase
MAAPQGQPSADLGLTPDELLTTTRTVRKRLDLERPVDRAVVEECLRIAFQAPNGSNRQEWGWVLVDDPAIKRAMGDLYRQGFEDHAASLAPRPDPNPDADLRSRVSDSVAWLRQRIEQVPVLLVPTIADSYGTDAAFATAGTWGSILPAVWSFMLALRARGMGSAWTTIHLYRGAEMAELLGIPHPGQRQAGLFPVAYTLGTDFKPADRALSERSIYWNGWGANTPDTPAGR